MKGTERRKALIAWLEQEGSLSLNEIVERFAISKMTAHRDLEALESRQLLKRIHGGAISIERPQSPAAASPVSAEQAVGQCVVCYRPTSQHLLYSLTLRSGEQYKACCPHCGVSAQMHYGDQVAMALTADYLTGRPHPVQGSYFLLGSAAVPCCKPSMLTFEDEEMARRFQAGFGGSLGRIEDAASFLLEEMSLHRDGDDCPHCAALARRGG